MSTEELLKPRYRVIAPWPGCQWSLGSVLIHIGNGNYDCQEEPTINGLRNPKDFPVNLQPLPWWKDRKVEDMPEYVKLVDSGEIRKVLKHHILMGRCTINNIDSYASWWLYISCEPATKEEYEAYNNQLKDGR